MQVNGNIEILDKSDYSTYAGLLHNSRAVFSFLTDQYRFGLTLIRGYVGGGYVGSTLYSNILKLAYSTDTWAYMASSLNVAIKYAGWASAMSNGYTFHNVRDGRTSNDRVNFATDSVQGIAARNYGSGASPSSCQHGVGYLPSALPSTQGGTYNTLASYGTRAYEIGKQTTNWDALTFSTEAWQAMSSGPYYQDAVGWFDKDYSYYYSSIESNTTTKRMAHSTETWGTYSTTSSPGALGMPGGSGAEKGVNSKVDKFYLAGNWGRFIS